MRSIAIDTSLGEGCVAAWEDGRVAEVRFAPASTHARRIAAALAEATAALGWHVADARLVAVVLGPGSFTGLRVGLSAAKGIAWAAGIPLAGVSGFERVAESTGIDRPLHVAFDAGRGELSVAAVTPDAASPSGWTTIESGPEAIDAWVDRIPAGAAVAGPALDLPLLAARLATRPDLEVADAARRAPSAAAVARIGGRLAAAGLFLDAAGAVPRYGRPSYAQENDRRPSR